MAPTTRLVTHSAAMLLSGSVLVVSSPSSCSRAPTHWIASAAGETLVMRLVLLWACTAPPMMEGVAWMVLLLVLWKATVVVVLA